MTSIPRTTGCPGAEPERWLGYRRHTHARSTGALVVLVDGHAQGLSAPQTPEEEKCGFTPDGRWFLICDEHSTLLSDENQARLRRHMCSPEEWCDGCRANFLGETS